MIILKRSLLSLLFFSHLLGATCPDSVFKSPKKEWKVATFAGGCFWCIQQAFDKTPGVEDTWVGFSGGELKNPTYKKVSDGTTGHFEVVRVFYTTTYEKILDTFWRNIDPTDGGGQFVDRGTSYKAAVFFHDESQKEKAENSRKEIKKIFKGKEIVTEILPVKVFYKAESYHQKYYKCSPIRYKYYKWRSGRSDFFKKYWGKK